MRSSAMLENIMCYELRFCLVLYVRSVCWTVGLAKNVQLKRHCH